MSDVDFSTIKQLSGDFGNTLTTTLWRVIENLDEPNFGLVSVHPQEARAQDTDTVGYFIRSERFVQQFPHVTARGLIGQLATFCHGRRGPIGQGEVVLKGAG